MNTLDPIAAAIATMLADPTLENAEELGSLVAAAERPEAAAYTAAILEALRQNEKAAAVAAALVTEYVMAQIGQYL